METTDSLFVSAIEGIYAAALEPKRWPAALQAVADVTGDLGAIMIYGRDDGTYGVIETESIEEIVVEYRAEWSGRDIRAIRASERGYFFKRDIITDEDVLSDEEMRSDPFYVEFLKRHGLRYFAALMISPSPHVEVAVSIQRRSDRAKYSEGEIASLRRLGPHLERSLRISLRLMDAELTDLAMGNALARIGIGVFALDALGRVTFSNAAAQHLIGDGLEIVNERLRITRMKDAIDSGTRDISDLSRDAVLAHGKPVLIRRRKSERAVALHVLPVGAPANAAETFLTRARALVLAVDLDLGSPPEPSLVRDLLGLTLGEARVASLVGTGLSPREAAERLSITEDTARTVLKRVFSKIGVSRQSELATMMARLALR